MAATSSRLQLSTIDGAPVVIVASGAIDIGTAPQLEDAVATQLGRSRAVVVDLAGVEMCDSTGLAVLVRMHRRAQADGTGFALRAPRRHVADILAMTGIDKAIVVLRRESTEDP
jgi:anti-sigma B factor antagonist